MHRQMSFDLPARTALGREDFFVAPSNAMAVALLDNWQDWPNGKLMISGPAGSGKTHLAHVWAEATGAKIMPATALNEALVPELVAGPLVVEDVHRIAEDADAQNALFHLHNLILAERQPLLLTAQGTPAHQVFSLPDLQSRLQGTQTALLDPPDDTLLAVILAKLFTDRGIVPKPDVIPYMIAHMDRSFAEATSLVERLDRTALSEKKNLSRAFVARVLNPK